MELFVVMEWLRRGKKGALKYSIDMIVPSSSDSYGSVALFLPCASASWLNGIQRRDSRQRIESSCLSLQARAIILIFSDFPYEVGKVNKIT